MKDTDQMTVDELIAYSLELADEAQHYARIAGWLATASLVFAAINIIVVVIA